MNLSEYERIEVNARTTEVMQALPDSPVTPCSSYPLFWEGFEPV
jgi:predicted nucleic acid-binding Zn ribbon protein